MTNHIVTTPNATTGTPGLPDAGTVVEAAVAEPIIGFVEAVNAGDLDRAVSFLAPDAIHHGRISNYRPEGVKVLFGMIRTVFPDLQMTIRDMRFEGGRVISRIVASGTHTGAYLGNEPTGQVIVWETTDIAIVDRAEIDTQFETDANPFRQVIERWWDLFNDPSLARDLGFPLGIMC